MTMGAVRARLVAELRDPLEPLVEEAPAIARSLAGRVGDEAEESALGPIIESVSGWCRDEVRSERIEVEGVSRDLRRSAARLGLFGLAIPGRYGGANLSLRATCSVIEELAAADCSLAICVGLHNGLGVRGLVRYGSDSLQERFLPDLAAGDRIAAFAATETVAGSDLTGIQARAAPGGPGRLRISASKAYITNGGFADVFTVFCRAPQGRRSGRALVLVERDAPGLSVGREEHKLGIRGSSTTPIELRDVLVPAEHVIGGVARGHAQLREVLAWGRTVLGAACLGVARSAYRRALGHVCERRQFGRPIGEFAQVREKIAGMRAGQSAMESVLRLTGHVQQEGDGDVSWESAAVKVFCSEWAWRTADDGVQLHGGSGVIEGTGVPRLLRDLRVTRIFEGANDVLRLHLANRNLLCLEGGSPRARLAGRLGSGLDVEARRFDALRRRVWDAAAELKGEGLGPKPQGGLAVARLGGAFANLYVLLAVLLRAEGEGGEEELQVARHLALLLGREIEAALTGASRRSEETLVEAISDRAYGGR